MSPERPQLPATFGYLSTVRSAEHGFFGGYLIVSLLGRPLEFHCTAPVRPSRAEQILYGPTLEPYLLGEQIGATLLREAKLRPQIVLTDHAATLTLRPKFEMPIVLVLDAIDERDSTSRSTCPLVVSGCTLELPAGHESDRSLVEPLLARLVEHVQLAEPFGRIHEAIREAQRIGEQTQHGQERAAA